MSEPLIAPNARAHLPNDIARCVPSRGCQQRANCARARAWPQDELLALPMIDASVALHTADAPCQLFLDVRGVALLEAA